MPVDGNTVLADEDMLPGDYYVKKDDLVLYSAYVMHRLPELWPEPMRFNPDRFIDETPKSFTYMPFHGGPRLCLGMDMAYLEARVALVVLLRRYKFVPADGFTPKMRIRIVLAADGGMIMNLVPRAKAAV